MFRSIQALSTRRKVHQRIEAVIDWYRESDNAAKAATVFDVVEGRSPP